jgi:hypothetical protein
MALARQQTTPADNLDKLITFNVEEIKTLIAQNLKRASGFAHIKADNRDPAAPPLAATNNREQLQIHHVTAVMDSPAGFLREAHLNPNDMFMASCTTPTRNQIMGLVLSKWLKALDRPSLLNPDSITEAMTSLDAGLMPAELSNVRDHLITVTGSDSVHDMLSLHGWKDWMKLLKAENSRLELLPGDPLIASGGFTPQLTSLFFAWMKKLSFVPSIQNGSVSSNVLNLGQRFGIGQQLMIACQKKFIGTLPDLKKMIHTDRFTWKQIQEMFGAPAPIDLGQINLFLIDVGVDPDRPRKIFQWKQQFILMPDAVKAAFLHRKISDGINGFENWRYLSTDDKKHLPLLNVSTVLIDTLDRICGVTPVFSELVPDPRDFSKRSTSSSSNDDGLSERKTWNKSDLTRICGHGGGLARSNKFKLVLQAINDINMRTAVNNMPVILAVCLVNVDIRALAILSRMCNPNMLRSFNQHLNIGISADDVGDLRTKEHRTVTPKILQREIQRLVVTGQADKYLATSTLTIHYALQESEGFMKHLLPFAPSLFGCIRIMSEQVMVVLRSLGISNTCEQAWNIMMIGFDALRIQIVAINQQPIRSTTLLSDVLTPLVCKQLLESGETCVAISMQDQLRKHIVMQRMLGSSSDYRKRDRSDNDDDNDVDTGNTNKKKKKKEKEKTPKPGDNNPNSDLAPIYSAFRASGMSFTKDAPTLARSEGGNACIYCYARNALRSDTSAPGSVKKCTNAYLHKKYKQIKSNPHHLKTVAGFVKAALAAKEEKQDH